MRCATVDVKAPATIKAIICLIALLLLLPPVTAGAALEPDEVLVIANRFVTGSVGVARYYQKARGIPKENLLKLDLPAAETCSREEYDKLVAGPVRRWLERQKNRRPVRCLLTVYGMPLKVRPTAPSEAEQRDYDEVKNLREEIRRELHDLPKDDPRRKELGERDERLMREMHLIGRDSELSALDSELALVMAGAYPLTRWVPNPSYLGSRGTKPENQPEIAYMVARLDGPDPDCVRRIIDDSLAAERDGLGGRAYFDARWPRPAADKAKNLAGYAFYDNSIHLAADRVRAQTKLPVVLNDRDELFQPGECPDAALYCGWYRLNHYLDAFDWRPGAVGYHIASGECTSLRNSKGWCLGMLSDGAAAVIGPVAEPYVQAFPPPELFFSLLTDGRFTLAECYALASPVRSWRMVLVGDPLYRPFRRSGAHAMPAQPDE